MADRKPNRWIVLTEKIVFRIAFGLYIVAAMALTGAAVGVVGVIVPDDWSFLQGILIVLFCLTPFLNGAASYLVYRRFTRVEYVRAESGRWLAERSERNTNEICRRHRIHRTLLWVPLVLVLSFCLFLDWTWAPASHFCYPRSGNLIGYRLSIPLNWAIAISETDTGPNPFSSSVWAYRSQRLFRDAAAFMFGRKPSTSVSYLRCTGSAPSDDHTYTPELGSEKPISSRVFPIGNTSLACGEFASREPQQVNITCTTPRGDLYCYFGGDRDSAADFYRMAERIRKKN